MKQKLRTEKLLKMENKVLKLFKYSPLGSNGRIAVAIITQKIEELKAKEKRQKSVQRLQKMIKLHKKIFRE